MHSFTYTFLFKIIFRFGNIIITMLLLVYLVPIVIHIDQNKILIIPLVISLIIIYVINGSYLTYYKILPYKIEADEEKMICSDFLFSKKSITIFYSNIEKLEGGIFAGRSSGIMKIQDAQSKIQLGFSQKLNNSGKLISLILSKVPKELYHEVIQKITEKKQHQKFGTKRNS